MAIRSETIKPEQTAAPGKRAAQQVSMWQRKSFQRAVRATIAYGFLLVGSFCFLDLAETG